jgi:hypothetical protein
MVIAMVFVLLFTQFFKLHMHLGHSDEALNQGHVVDLHLASAQPHDLQHESHHLDDIEHHDHDVVDIEPSVLLLKNSVVKQFVAILLLVIVVFNFSIVIQRVRRPSYKQNSKTFDYLISPPLRAPPL